MFSILPLLASFLIVSFVVTVGLRAVYLLFPVSDRKH